MAASVSSARGDAGRRPRVLTGSARLAKEAEDEAALIAHAAEIEGHRQELERKRRLVDTQIAELREQLAADEAAVERSIQETRRRQDRLMANRRAMGKSRHAFEAGRRT